MSYSKLVSKLLTLKYPFVSRLQRTPQISFTEFTLIINFLENEHVRILDDNERHLVRPTDENGDVSQYMNNLTEYFSNEDLMAPPIFVNLCTKIISSPPPPSMSPMNPSSQDNAIGGVVRATVVLASNETETITTQYQATLNAEARTRLQLLTFLTSKAIEFEYSDTINATSLAETSVGNIELTYGEHGEKKNLSTIPEPDFPSNIINSILLSDELQLNIGDKKLIGKHSIPTFQQVLLKQVEKILETMSLNKKLPLQMVSKLISYNGIPIQAAIESEQEASEYNALVEKINLDETVIKPIAYWISMTSGNVDTVHGNANVNAKNTASLSTKPSTILSSSSVHATDTATIPSRTSIKTTTNTSSSSTNTTPTSIEGKVVVTAKIIIPDQDMDNDTTTAIISIPSQSIQKQTNIVKNPPRTKSNQKSSSLSSSISIIPYIPNITMINTYQYTTSVKPIFEITNIDEHNMALYQYILYTVSLYVYMIPITSKLGIYFTLPRDLYEYSIVFNQYVTSLSTQFANPTPTPTPAATPTPAPLDTITKYDPLTLFIQVKAVNIVLSSVLREFARKIQSELTTVLLALKTFEPSQTIGSIDHALTISLDDAVKYDEKGQIVVDAKVPLTMPTHIFVDSSSNFKNNTPLPTKEDKNDKDDQDDQDDKSGKGGKRGKFSKGGKDAKNTKLDINDEKTGTSAAEHEKFIDTTLLPKTSFISASIRQQRLRNEQFASRNATTTTFINDRYHFNKLLSIAQLQSQDALNQILTLNTLPLGESAIQPQLAAQVNDITSKQAQSREKKLIQNDAQVEKGENGKPNENIKKVQEVEIDTNDTTMSDKAPIPITTPKVSTKGKGKVNQNKSVESTTAVSLSPAQVENLTMLSRPESFLSIFVTLVRMLYDIELQQHQTVITRWIQHLQTFTARANDGKVCKYEYSHYK